MSIENEADLFKWLIKELSPICDAEPDTLANYVVALVKKPKSEEEKRKFMIEQLGLFLNDQTQTFVDKCLEVLAVKSYIAKSDEPVDKPTSSVKSVEKKEDVKPAVKTEVSKTTEDRKRAKVSPSKNEDNGKDDSRNGRLQRRRISPPSPEKDRADNKRRRVSKSPPRERRRRRSDERRDRRRSRSRSEESRSPQYRRGRDVRRKRCKDFDEVGFCKKGEKCPYDHGADPVVVERAAAASMVNLDFPPGAINFSIPPPQTFLSVPPPGVDGYNPAVPPPGGAECYNPEAPALINPGANFSIPPPVLPWQRNAQSMMMSTAVQPHSLGPYQQAPLHQQQVYGGSVRGGTRGRGAPRYQNTGVRGSRNDGTMLQVKKIPVEMNTIAKLNEHFATFGTIENIQVRHNNDPQAALIKFSNRYEAQKAFKSPTPVFSNRFIKVFWHNEDAGNGAEQGGEGIQNVTQTENRPPPPERQKIAKPSEAKFVSEEMKEQRQKLAEANARYGREREQMQVLIDLQKRNTEMVDKLMIKQKLLLAKARVTTDEAERQKITTLIKKVHANMKTLKTESDEMLTTMGEKTQALDEAKQILDALKANKKESSVEKDYVTKENTEDNERVVVVRGVPENDIADVVAHMEFFGELENWSCGDKEGQGFVATFPFKKAQDAKRAIAKGRVMNGIALEMELQVTDPLPVAIEEADDVRDANLSAGQLLAAVDGEQYDD